MDWFITIIWYLIIPMIVFFYHFFLPKLTVEKAVKKDRIRSLISLLEHRKVKLWMGVIRNENRYKTTKDALEIHTGVVRILPYGKGMRQLLFISEEVCDFAQSDEYILAIPDLKEITGLDPVLRFDDIQWLSLDEPPKNINACEKNFIYMSSFSATWCHSDRSVSPQGSSVNTFYQRVLAATE